MPNSIEIIARLVLAGVLGALIGWERRAHLKDAGLRTHFVVAIGAALFMVVSKYSFSDMEHVHGISIDPSRIAAQVASGIGFLGAGTIMVQRNTVRGLTTAAGLWATAGIGLAAGSGLYFISASGTLLVVFGLWSLKWMERRLVGTIDQISITGNNSPEIIGKIGEALKGINVNIERIEFDLVEKQTITIGLYVKAIRRDTTKEQIAEALTNVPGVERLRFGGQHTSL